MSVPRPGAYDVSREISPNPFRCRTATDAALRLLVAREGERPLYARVAADNAASVAVLQRNGFGEISRETSYAPGRGTDIEEVVFALAPTLDGV